MPCLVMPCHALHAEIKNLESLCQRLNDVSAALHLTTPLNA